MVQQKSDPAAPSQDQKEDWPYDAERRDDRIPIVRSLYPRWCYHLAVCVDEDEEEPGRIWRGLRPTDEEIAIISDFLEYTLSDYYEWWREEMRRRHPFDIDGGHNTLVLIKRGEGDWAYRRDTWTQYLAPGYDDPKIDLPELLDRITGHGGEPSSRWVEWKNRDKDTASVKN